MIIGMAVVIPLSIAQWRSGYASASVFYALFPGNAIHLLITGGHGRAAFSDVIAPYAAVLTNIAAYSVLIFICMRVGRAVKRV